MNEKGESERRERGGEGERREEEESEEERVYNTKIDSSNLICSIKYSTRYYRIENPTSKNSLSN